MQQGGVQGAGLHCPTVCQVQLPAANGHIVSGPSDGMASKENAQERGVRGRGYREGARQVLLQPV